MAAITFANFKTRLALRLGNLQSGNPFYAYLDEWVNQATNEVILRSVQQTKRASFNLFPELRTPWTDITVVNTESLQVPNNLLVLHDVFSFDSSDVPDLDDDTRTELAECDSIRTFESLPRGTTYIDWPRIWVRDGNYVKVWPTPRATKLTYLLLRGIKKETDMSANADEPQMNALWHPAVLDYATYLGASERGWHDDAAKWLAACDKKITQTVDVLGLHNAAGDHAVRIRGGVR